MDLRTATLGDPSPEDLRRSVLHAPVEIAGQAGLAVAGLRELGVRARTFAARHPFEFEDVARINPAPGRRGWLTAAARALARHDVVHYHFGEGLVRHALDARLARRLGRRVVVEFHGSDVRIPSVERERNPYYVQLDGEDDAKARTLLRRWSAITQGHAVLCDQGLLRFVRPYFPHVHIVGHRTRVMGVRPAPPDTSARVPLVVHSPSDLAAKGTVHVRAAVAALRDEGARFDYAEIHGRPHRESLALYRRADLVVDQLCSGTHGVAAAEAMALGKPVICFILDELAPGFPPGFPIIDASPATFTGVLRDWIGPDAGPRRNERGLASRAYAERVHDVRAVARRLLHVYAQLP